MKIKVCSVDKSSPLRVLAQDQIKSKVIFRNEKMYNKNIQHNAKRRFSEFF